MAYVYLRQQLGKGEKDVAKAPILQAGVNDMSGTEGSQAAVWVRTAQ